MDCRLEKRETAGWKAAVHDSQDGYLTYLNSYNYFSGARPSAR